MESIGQEKAVKKWTVFNDCEKAFKQLQLEKGSLKVLWALLSFYPGPELHSGVELIIFAGNKKLCRRANRIKESTLRKHIGVLVNAGLIIRKNSANRKRYPLKNKAGEIVDAYGFDLSPLLLRSEEISDLAEKVEADEGTFHCEQKRLNSVQKYVKDIIKMAIEDGVCGDWDQIERRYRAIVERQGRDQQLEEVRAALESLSRLRSEIFTILEAYYVPPISDADAAINRRRIEDSKPESFFEFESGSELDQGETAEAESKAMRERLKVFPLGMVLRACPDIIDYGPGGRIACWCDLISAAAVVRSTLNISPSAYQAARKVMGLENAATATACILQRAEHIKSAGGYLRDLTGKAARDEFSLEPVLMALLKARKEIVA